MVPRSIHEYEYWAGAQFMNMNSIHDFYAASPSRHDEVCGRACIGAWGRACAARREVCECWIVAPAPYSDGTVVHSVTLHAQPTP